jgi:hypothetical protein
MSPLLVFCFGQGSEDVRVLVQELSDVLARLSSQIDLFYWSFG